MNKKILTIAITCSFCFLLITNYVVADKPEWAGKPEGIIKQQAEKAKEEAEREAEKAKEEAAREAEKAKEEAEREATKVEREVEHDLPPLLVPPLKLEFRMIQTVVA